MHLHEITSDSLTKLLSQTVPEFFVVIAKHSVMGMDHESIKGILGCEVQDLVEVESTELYKAVKAHASMAYAQQTTNQATGWDAIEDIAIKALIKRLPFEKDGDFLLRAAAVANKAVRKTGKDSGVLDPAERQGRVAITLTHRLTQTLSRTGHRVQTTERVLSIHDGSMGNPTFDEVDSLLDVRANPALPKALEISTRNADPTIEELLNISK